MHKCKWDIILLQAMLTVKLFKNFTNSFQLTLIILGGRHNHHFTDKELRHKEVWLLSQRHMTFKWWCRDLNTGHLAPSALQCGWPYGKDINDKLQAGSQCPYCQECHHGYSSFSADSFCFLKEMRNCWNSAKVRQPEAAADHSHTWVFCRAARGKNS